MVQSMTNQAMFPATIKNLRFDPIADFEPITQIVRLADVIVAHPSFPATSMAQLVAYARAKPGAITFASFGQGSTSHLGIELLMKLASIQGQSHPVQGRRSGGGGCACRACAGRHRRRAGRAAPYQAEPAARASLSRLEARIPQLPETPSVNETSGLEAYDLSITYVFPRAAQNAAGHHRAPERLGARGNRSSEFAQKMLEIGNGRADRQQPGSDGRVHPQGNRDARGSRQGRGNRA
jgi:tripartite-type tricarboxylate transporter receptor subunit TctC